MQDFNLQTENAVNRIMIALFLALFCALWTATAFAQAYPLKTIRMIVPSASGAAPDIIGRVVSPKLSEGLGQTVIVDHGLGVYSSYSHLSQIAVKVDDPVEKGTVLGQTGTTGLAGGDHLHFAVVLQGEFVDPIEWWDAHWLKDQVEGVWLKATSPAPETAQAPAQEGKAKKQGGKEHKPKPKKKK